MEDCQNESSREEVKTPETLLEFVWEEVVQVDESRVGAMYCFKSCNVNQN